MKLKIVAVVAAVQLIALACAGGPGSSSILPDVSEHLQLAKKCMLSNNAERGLAHTQVVNPDHRIRVRVDCGPLVGAQQTPFRNALSGAMKMWCDAFGEDLFVIAETGETDVIVKFQPDVRDRGVSVAAHVDWTRGVANELSAPTPVLNAHITMRTLSPKGESLTYDQLKASLAHELGHVLGLTDSSRPGSVMGVMDYRNPARSILYSDVAELLTMRREAKQIRQLFLAKRPR